VNSKNFLIQSSTHLRKKRTLKKKVEKFLMRSALNFKILEIRKKKLMTNNVKTVAILKTFVTLKRKSLKMRFPKKTSLVTSKLKTAKKKVLKKN